jgi:hypothetical protein
LRTKTAAVERACQYQPGIAVSDLEAMLERADAAVRSGQNYEASLAQLRARLAATLEVTA